MEAAESADLARFRDEARAWLEANFPKSLAGRDDEPIAPYGPATPSADQELWRQRMAAKGWSAPTWPAAYGGGGLSADEAQVLQQEMGRIGALNPVGGMGTSMFGPTLLEYGTEAQKQRYIPDIVAGKVWWCQGYSEPGSGSDLASLADPRRGQGRPLPGQRPEDLDLRRAVRRHDASASCAPTPRKKHEGISFVVFSMHQPGVEVRPIMLIAGHSPFCETFFTNVEVPKANLIGRLNGGWSVAKRLLQYERSPGSASQVRQPELGVVAKQYLGEDADGRLADADLRMRIAANAIEQRAVQLTNRRVAAEAKGNAGPSAASSILKNANAKAAQDRAELLLEAMGAQGLGWDGADYTEDELTSIRGWLSGKAASIYSGSHEVQNNVISKRLLGLPDATRAS